MFIPTRKQDAKTAKKKNHRASGLPSCWASDKNKSRATSARDRIGVSRRNNEQAATLFLELSQGIQKDFQFYNNRPNFFRNTFGNTTNLWRRSLYGVTCRHFTSHLLHIAVLCLFFAGSEPTRSPQCFWSVFNGKKAHYFEKK